jgi:hypothetical protein
LPPAARAHRDHKPDVPEEASRIRRAGGRVAKSRSVGRQAGGGPCQAGSGWVGLGCSCTLCMACVPARRNGRGHPVGPARVWLPDLDYPGLAMSRALGDTIARPIGVIPTPEVSVQKVCACVVLWGTLSAGGRLAGPCRQHQGPGRCYSPLIFSSC